MTKKEYENLVKDLQCTTTPIKVLIRGKGVAYRVVNAQNERVTLDFFGDGIGTMHYRSLSRVRM